MDLIFDTVLIWMSIIVIVAADVGLREGQPGFDMIIDMDGGDTSRNSHQQHQNQMMRQRVHLEDRNDTMTDIEQTIVELGGIFQQLATMVKEQEEIVQRYVWSSDAAELLMLSYVGWFRHIPPTWY